MKHTLFAVALILFVSPVFAADDPATSSLQLSLEETDSALSYRVFGSSVVSEGDHSQHSLFDLSALPPKSVISKAFLYWAGEVEANKAADTQVDLKDPEGNKKVIHAEKVWTNVVSGLVYVSKAEIGRHLQQRGIYEISHIDADPLEPATIAGKVQKKAHYTLGGWSLVVLYKDPQINRRNTIQIYDGLLYLPSGDAKREGRFGMDKAGHAVSKKEVYPETTVKIKAKGPANTLDMTTISGFGKPWDGGSITLDGKPVSGREDFVGNSGFSWDINRDIVLLDSRAEHTIEFLPDYNSIMPIAVVAQFGASDKEDVARLASFYVEQADQLDGARFFDLRSSTLEEREFLVKEYIKEILREKAVALLKTAKGANLADASLHSALGQLYLESGMLDLAETELKAAAESGKASGRTYLNLGRLYYEKRDIDEAIRYLEIAKAASAKDPLIRRNLGMCLLQKGLIEQAIPEFEEAVRLNPNDPAPYHCLYGIYESQGRLAKKVAVLKRLEELKEKESN